MSSRNFPDLVKAYLEFVSGHEGTARTHLWSFLSVVAGALERRVFLERGYYTLFPNLYVVIIGKSGLLKKSTTTAVAVNLLRELEGVKIMSDRLTASSLIHQLGGALKTFQLEGYPVKQSPIFAYASELSVFLTEVAGSVQELLTTFYDCIPHDSSKPWMNTTVSGGEMKIYGPCLNLLGASTQTWLRKCLPASEMEGGFSSRIIFVVETKAPDKLVAWPKVSSANGAVRERILEDLLMIYKLQGPMKPTPGAKKVFEEFYNFHMKHVVPHQTDVKWSGWLGRKGDMILKVAMVRSVTLRASLEITEKDILWASEQLEMLEADMFDAFEGVGTSPTAGLTFGLKNFIRGRRTVERSEIFRAFAQQAPGAEITRALSDLLEMREIAVSRETKDGREGPVYRFVGSPSQG